MASTYAEQGATYRDMGTRQRIEACAREQGLIFSNDGRADIASLGRGVTAGTYLDIDAIIAAVVASPAADITEDAGLLGAVQAVWPSVAAARYPQS